MENRIKKLEEQVEGLIELTTFLATKIDELTTDYEESGIYIDGTPEYVKEYYKSIKEKEVK